MKSHELARVLLMMPDLDVKVRNGVGALIADVKALRVGREFVNEPDSRQVLQIDSDEEEE